MSAHVENERAAALEPELDLDHLIDRWRGPIVGLLSARGSSWDEAEELAQDVFAQAWMARARFRGDVNDARSVGAWLAGIARNLHRDRRRPRPARVVSIDATPHEGADGFATEDEAATEEAALVLAAVERLPDAEREAVQAFYLETSTTGEVAGLLGITERAVEGLLYRARKRLRQWL